MIEEATQAPSAFNLQLEAHTMLKGILDRSIEANTLSPDVGKVWLGMASATYAVDPRLARDEAIRSGSLAGMTLMLAATHRGFATCPVGFSAAQVQGILGFSERFVPVMMLAIGHPAAGNTPRRPRLPLDQILSFNTSEPF